MAASYPGKPKTRYEASCHCSLVQYSVLIPSLTGPDALKVNNCNCSICEANGYLLVYPNRDEVTWHQGYDKLKEYRCATKIKIHKFCGECGSSLLIDWNGWSEKRDVLCMNVRMFKGVEIKELNVENTDNRGEGPKKTEDDVKGMK